jgi:hypothetical protein
VTSGTFISFKSGKEETALQGEGSKVRPSNGPGLLQHKRKKLKEQESSSLLEGQLMEENLSRMIPEQVPRSAHQH